MKKILILLLACFGFIQCNEPDIPDNTIKTNPEDIELDTAMHVVEELKSLPIILGENDFGTLTLKKDRTLSIDTLMINFEGYSILKQTGHQDGPDYVYYEINKGERQLAFIKMHDEDQELLDRIQITDTTVFDEYGISIGTSYKELKLARPALESVVADHFRVFVTEVGSPLGYEIEGPFEGPDRMEFTDEELAEWKVIRLIWFNPDF